MSPKIIKPFSDKEFNAIKNITKEISAHFQGKPYHDQELPKSKRFNRHEWYDLPLLKEFHSDLTKMASKIFGEPVKPSYSFLSLYGDKGICPGHIDRQECRYTIDLCVSQKSPWALFVGKDKNDKVGKKYILKEKEALCYSGTDQWHYRKKIQKGNWVHLVFFHFVPEDFKLKSAKKSSTFVKASK